MSAANAANKPKTADSADAKPKATNSADTKKKSDRFWVEKRDVDFPLYNDDSFGTKGMIALMVGLILIGVWAFAPMNFDVPRLVRSLGFFLMATVPFLIASNGRFGLLFKRPRIYDFFLVIIGAVALFFVSAWMIILLMNVGAINPSNVRPNPIVNEKHDTVFAIAFIFQIFGEELLKIDAFIIVLTWIYRRYNRRKLGIILGIAVAALYFGILHYTAYGNLAQVIFVQGTAGALMLYMYLRTKNIMVPYLAHLLMDVIAMVGSSPR